MVCLEMKSRLLVRLNLFQLIILQYTLVLETDLFIRALLERIDRYQTGQLYKKSN